MHLKAYLGAEFSPQSCGQSHKGILDAMQVSKQIKYWKGSSSKAQTLGSVANLAKKEREGAAGTAGSQCESRWLRMASVKGLANGNGHFDGRN